MSRAATTADGARSATSVAGTAAASIALPRFWDPAEVLCQHSAGLSSCKIDPVAVRMWFSALAGDTVFFDAPGGTQVPDEVVEAIAGYLREWNANLGGTFERSRQSDLLVGEARRAAAGFL